MLSFAQESALGRASAPENALLQLPFVSSGLCPEAASSALLPKLAGYQRAAELLLLGEPFSAQQAKEIGLVNGVLPDAAVLERARSRAAQLAALPSGQKRKADFSRFD